MAMLNVFDLTTRKKTAVLQNAFDIVETQELNKIYMLSFSIPANDDKVQYCLPRHYIRWGDKGELYRIIKPTKKNDDTSIITYECEHVIATLCDKIMFGSFQYGGWQMKTSAVIEWLLSQQNVKNWVLGECDFDRRFEYLWEQENILNALYAIPKEFAQPYMWTFDTTVYPWRLNLKMIDDSIHPEYYLRAKRNLLSSGTTENYADICTRIYPLGYGEGVNQLNIKDVNNGVPYLQSPDNIVAQYGIVEKVLVDRRFENAESLKAYAQTMLDGLQTPSMSREFEAVDLYPLTNDDFDNAKVGKIVKMVQDDSTAYITKTQRTLDSAGDLKIELSTKTSDIASTIADLADRVRIESVYAQGATQLYQHSKDENATPEKGMIMSLYFPEEMRQINKVLLKMSLNHFRSYSDTTEDAGSSTPTTSDGGSSMETTSSGGSSTPTTSSGGGSTPTTSAGGATGTTSTGSSTISASAISGSSSIETTESGGTGSDIVTSNTVVQGKTASIPVTVQGVVKNNAGLLPSTTPVQLSTDEISLNTENGGEGTTGETEARTKNLTGLMTGSNEGGSTSEVTLTTGNANISISGNTNAGTFDLKGHSTTGPVNASGQSRTSTDSTNVSISVSGSTGNSSPGTSYEGSHNHNIWCYTGEVTPPASANYRHSHSINYTGGALANGSHSHTVNSHSHWFSQTASGSHSHGMNHFHSFNLSGVGSHSHSFSLYGVGSHSHGIGNHSHTIGAHSHTVNNHSHTVMAHSHELTAHFHTIPAHKHTVQTHSHLIPDHTHTTLNHLHYLDCVEHSHSISKALFNHTHGMEHTHTINLNGVGSHSHSFSIPAHTHEVSIPSHSHTVEIPSHSHTVNIPAHSHTVTIPAHSHKIVPGIFESGNASGFDIYVNGKKITTVSKTYYEDDITQWLLNEDRQIPRDTWIEVEVRPNDLAYVVSTVFVQGFVQSRGGGNY